MKNTRLVKLMKTFTKEEFKQFGKFVNSPFIQSSRKINLLYDCLSHFYPDFDSSVLTKKEIFKKLFNDQKYNEKKLQNFIFDLTKSCEYFLAHLNLDYDDTEFQLYLSKGYLNKNLPNESNRINKTIEKKLWLPSFSREKDYFSKLKRLSHLKYNYHDGRKEFNNISKCVQSLFEATSLQFIFEYMHFISEMKILYLNFGCKNENEFIKKIIGSIKFEKLLKLLEESEYINNPLICLHYYRFKTIVDDNNHSYYFLLKDLVLNNLSALDREEKWFFFSHLVNYAMEKEDNLIDGFRNESLSNFKLMLEHKAYSPSENKYMDLLTFRNIILSCNTQKEAGWLKYFTENYAKYLDPEHRVNLKHFALAYYYFLIKEFKLSLDYNVKINNKFFFFKTDVKESLLRVYYELGYFKEARTLLEAFRHFIKENKQLTEIYKKPFNNFIKQYSELLKIKSGRNRGIPLRIKSRIEKETDIICKFWLIEKADELIKERRAWEYSRVRAV